MLHEAATRTLTSARPAPEIDARPEAARPDSKPEARIDVTAQLLSVQPGIYALELAPGAVSRTSGGMMLPCARLDPLPHAEHLAHFASLSASSLLLPGGSPGFLRAEAATSVLLTIYKLAGSGAAPEFRIRAIAPASAPPPPAPKPDIPSQPCTLTVHVERHGDLPVPGGAWAEAPGGSAAIEGFSIQPDDPALARAIEYQAVLGHDWLSPWSHAGEFCGSRGLALPLLGVRIRLQGAAAETTRCLVYGRSGGAEIGPVEDETLLTENGAPLTALRVAFVARETTPTTRQKRKTRPGASCNAR